MKQQKWIIGPVLLATTVGLASIAGAQNNPGNQPQQGGQGGRGGQGGGRNMTPEQRAQMMAQMEQRRVQARQDWVRQAMTASSFTDKAVQDAVIAFMAAQDKATVPLQEQANELSALLIDPKATDEQIKTSLADFRQAVANDKKRHDTELAALDTQAKYSTQPRLETLLTLLGVVGYEIPQVGGIGAVFPDSPYGSNRGGRGGGQGGPGGGGPGGGGPGGPGGGGPGGNAPRQ